MTALIGSPTTKATFDDNTWLYITEVTRPRLPGPKRAEPAVLVLRFDDKGVLRVATKPDDDDTMPVSIVADRRLRRAPRRVHATVARQRRPVERGRSGPARAAGGAGTGLLTAADVGAARRRQCQRTNAGAISVGGTTTRFSAVQPPVASIAPDAKAVQATLPNTMKSLVAWTRTRSCGSWAVASSVVPPTNMKFQPTPSITSATMNVATTGGKPVDGDAEQVSTAPMQMIGWAPKRWISRPVMKPAGTWRWSGRG